MKMSNKLILSEAISYYEDFDGTLEESLFNWLVERAEKTERYELALKEIAEETGTPYATIAEKALNS